MLADEIRTGIKNQRDDNSNQKNAEQASTEHLFDICSIFAYGIYHEPGRRKPDSGRGKRDRHGENRHNQLEEPNSRRAKLIGQVHIEGYADCPHKKSSYGQYCGIPKELLCFFHEQHLFPKIIHSMRDHRWIICKSDNFKGHVFSYAKFVQIG